MAKTEVFGTQIKNGSIELVDLGTTVVDELNSKVSASSLATVATSGSYNDLSNKPSIPSLTQVESDISALQAADIAIDARLDVLEANGGSGGGSGSYIAPYITEFNHTGSDSPSLYTITHNLNFQNVDVKVYLVDTSTGIETIAQDYFSYYDQNYGYSVIEKTANAFTLRMYRCYPVANNNVTGTYKVRVVVSVVGTSASSGSGASYEIAEFTHPEQANSYATYTYVHNLNTLNPVVEMFFNSFEGQFFSGVGGWMPIPKIGWGTLAYHGYFSKVVDANTVQVFISRVLASSAQVRGVIYAGASANGAIEVFQDAEFTWADNSSIVRAIAHNKNRQPDDVKVFVKHPTTGVWVQHWDIIESGGQVIGWQHFTNNSDNNQTQIFLYKTNADLTYQTKIRLYWYGNHDIETTPAGAYSVGGGASSSKRFVSQEFQHTSNNNGTVYAVPHNFGDFPDYIGVQLKVGDVWVNHNSFYYVNAAGGISYGFAATETSTINTAQVKVYYLRYDLGASPGGVDVASGTIRIVCGKF